MKFLDLFRMSVSNLWKRKLRTILTVLGVIIGTASIVVMVSLGMGLNKSMLESIESSGGLTTINVSAGDQGMVYSVDSTSATSKTDDSKDEPKQLTDESIATIAQIPNVTIVSPILSTSVILKQGAYECNVSLQGMSLDALNKLDIPLEWGSLPVKDAGEVTLLYGNQVLLNFYNAKTQKYYWDTGELPPVDFKKPLFIIYDTDAYYQSQNQNNSGDTGTGQPTTKVDPPKKYVVNTSGLVEGGTEGYNNYSYNVYCDIETLKLQLKKVFKNKVIPGQPTTKSGKPYKELYYTEAYVKVDDMDHVKEVQSAISDLGYNANSNIEWLESSQKQYQTVQAVLGGIGAVSLFVAAIGIANTMMMSIYERTKEIGIMKVLGCALNNIRSMFLMEAGFIGFLGGVLGVGLSYIISIIINQLVGGMYGEGTTVSYIPIWLSVAALVFAVFVGMIAGFFPALRAMRLSPLAAIRNE